MDVVFWLQLDGPLTGVGGGAHKRKFTVFVLRTTYFCGATIS